MSAVAMTGDQKRKVYWKIFYILGALTVFELIVASNHIPGVSPVVNTILIVAASLTKAAAVGWIYMHLNHEAKGLKVILLFPLFVAFFYAVFLITDAKLTIRRHANPYIGQPKRFFGQRRLHERKMDDFGNTIKDEPVTAAHEGTPRGEGEAPKGVVTEAPATATQPATKVEPAKATGAESAPQDKELNENKK